jgi:hypothetical protein
MIGNPFDLQVKCFENAGRAWPSFKSFVGVEGSQPIGGVRTFLQLG